MRETPATKTMRINTLPSEPIGVICDFLTPQELKAFDEAYGRAKFPGPMNLIWEKKFRIHFKEQYFKLLKENKKIDWKTAFKEQDARQYSNLSLARKDLFYVLKEENIQTKDFDAALKKIEDEGLPLIDILLFKNPIKDKNDLTLIECAVREKAAVARNKFYEIIAKAYHEDAEKFKKSDPKGNSLLHWAVYLKQSNDIILNLIYKNPGDLNKKNKQGNTLLHEACSNGYVDIFLLLLQCQKLDRNAKANNGDTLLHKACFNGHTDIVALLLQCPNLINLNDIDNYGYTALHKACFKGYTPIVKLLLQCSNLINPNAKATNGRTELHLACLYGYTDIVALLLQHPELINLNDTDNYGNTALHLACFKGYTQLVEFLLKQKDLQVNTKNEKGKTPLDVALVKGHSAIVNILRERARINSLHSENAIHPSEESPVQGPSSNTVNQASHPINNVGFFSPTHLTNIAEQEENQTANDSTLSKTT